MALVFQTRYELRVARQLVVEAQARLALQHANAKVDPDVSVGYKRTVGVDTVYAAVSVPLPFRNRNQGNIISADADVRTAKANLQALQNVILAEVAAAQEEFQLRNNLLSQTLPGLRRDAEETVRIARLAYREGGMDLLRLLDAERSRLDTEVLYFQSLSLFQQSVVNLQTATGAAPGSMAPESSPTPNPTKP
jgi:cobalt-zinc-cadmium efflux system outer membrane protein